MIKINIESAVDRNKRKQEALIGMESSDLLDMNRNATQDLEVRRVEIVLGKKTIKIPAIFCPR